MAWLEGILGGFTERKREIETQNLEEARLAGDREAKVYEALLSSPDPEIQSMAAAGLLESTQPRKRKGGLKGWLGEMQQSPTFSRLQDLIKTPVQTGAGTLPELGHTQYNAPAGAPTATIPTRPPSIEEAPAGMPAQSLTQPGAAPAPAIQPSTPAPGQPAVGAPPPAAQAAAPAAGPLAAQRGVPTQTQIPAKVGTPPTMGPRQVFASPYDTALAASTAKARGDVEGEVAGLVAAGFSDTEARELVRQGYLRRTGAGGMQSIAGEVLNADGTITPAFGVFNRQTGGYDNPETGRPHTNFRPRTSTGSSSSGTDRDALSRSMFAKPFNQLTQAQQQQVQAELPKFAGQMAYGRGIGGGQAQIATELASPIGATVAKVYGVSPTTTLAELRNMVTLDDAQKDRVYALSQIDVGLDEIERLLPKVFPAVQEGVGGAWKTALSLGMQKLAGDGDLAALDAAISGALAQAAQLAGQPGSRLSDRDIEVARNQLASLTPSFFGGDTIITARERVGVLRRLFEKAQQSIPTNPNPPGVISVRPPGPPVRQVTPPPAGSAGPAGWMVDSQGNLVAPGAR